LVRIGIRREDKSRWEGRVPLIPPDVEQLSREEGIAFTVQPSPIRAFDDAEYLDAGAEVDESLADCPIIMGVKEIPPDLFEPDRTYVYFSHTIKGQPANMPALRRLLELGCTLIDYEKITDERGRRLVFFGRFAGIAGMIDGLWALGRRLEHEGLPGNLFAQVRQAHHYADLADVRRAFADLAGRLRADGLPATLRPFVCGFAGYGQVSQGAQEIFDLLPVEEVTPEALPDLPPAADICYKVVFHERHLVERRDPTRPFELQEYYDHPELYRDAFMHHAPHLSMLVNCIYWEPRYPRLLSREQLAALYGPAGGRQPRLRVIGDISCDIDGSVACTVRTTEPDAPVYVYEPATGETRDGVAGHGPVVLAVDFLPCELPVDASRHFSTALKPFLPGLAALDTGAPLERCGLPPELRRATIAYRGELTAPYRHLEAHLRAGTGGAPAAARPAAARPVAARAAKRQRTSGQGGAHRV
jgi:alpha-aminoadipic semialdehyde synthase